MGSNRFVVSDPTAMFAVEFPRKGGCEWHLVLSRDGGAQLCDAISSATARERLSTIVIPCTHGRKHARFQWKSELQIVVPTVAECATPEVSDADGIFRMIVPRSQFPVLTQVGEAIQRGEWDICFELADSQNFWVWSDGYRPI